VGHQASGSHAAGALCCPHGIERLKLCQRLKELKGTEVISFISCKTNMKVFLQYLLSPVLVVVIGVIFNFQIEKEKKMIQQLQIAQSMLDTLFSEDEFKALATKRLMDELLESEELEKEMSNIVEDYLKTKFDISVEQGDYETASNILVAAQTIGGDAGANISKQIEEDTHKKEAISVYQEARENELKGFNALIEGNFEKALTNFKNAYELYPDLHSVSEIYTLLVSSQSSFDEKQTRQMIYSEILDRYTWKVPQDLVQNLKRKQLEK
jgi:tetratricopeptide (TPR) repeat protein